MQPIASSVVSCSNGAHLRRQRSGSGWRSRRRAADTVGHARADVPDLNESTLSPNGGRVLSLHSDSTTIIHYGQIIDPRLSLVSL